MQSKRQWAEWETHTIPTDTENQQTNLSYCQQFRQTIRRHSSNWRSIRFRLALTSYIKKRKPAKKVVSLPFTPNFFQFKIMMIFKHVTNSGLILIGKGLTTSVRPGWAESFCLMSCSCGLLLMLFMRYQVWCCNRYLWLTDVDVMQAMQKLLLNNIMIRSKQRQQHTHTTSCQLHCSIIAITPHTIASLWQELLHFWYDHTNAASVLRSPNIEITNGGIDRTQFLLYWHHGRQDLALLSTPNNTHYFTHRIISGNLHSKQSWEKWEITQYQCDGVVGDDERTDFYLHIISLASFLLLLAVDLHTFIRNNLIRHYHDDILCSSCWMEIASTKLFRANQIS